VTGNQLKYSNLLPIPKILPDIKVIEEQKRKLSERKKALKDDSVGKKA
jgi:hypothetical protein